MHRINHNKNNRHPIEITMPTRKHYYAQLLIADQTLADDILKGVYASKFAIEMRKIIKQEVSVYTSKMKG